MQQGCIAGPCIAWGSQAAANSDGSEQDPFMSKTRMTHLDADCAVDKAAALQ
jgi:hypothetical protein